MALDQSKQAAKALGEQVASAMAQTVREAFQLGVSSTAQMSVSLAADGKLANAIADLQDAQKILQQIEESETTQETTSTRPGLGIMPGAPMFAQIPSESTPPRGLPGETPDDTTLTTSTRPQPPGT